MTYLSAFFEPNLSDGIIIKAQNENEINQQNNIQESKDPLSNNGQINLYADNNAQINDENFNIENVVKSTNKDENNNAVSLTLADYDFHEWGTPFYAIPVESFMPTISVTYNVKVADNGTVTREKVTNKIIFNKDNVANLRKTGLTPGKINSLEIAIVPDHLYILADQDQYIGYLVME